jgi:hypothetical protein
VLLHPFGEQRHKDRRMTAASHTRPLDGLLNLRIERARRAGMRSLEYPWFQREVRRPPGDRCLDDLTMFG